MKKIINPWKGMEGYNCFGCAPNNEAGVKMEFYEDGDEVISIWKPQPQFQGWIDTDLCGKCFAVCTYTKQYLKQKQ